MVAALALATLTPSCHLFRRSSKQVPFAPPPPAQPAAARPPAVVPPAPPEIPPQTPDLSQQAPQAPAEQLPPPPRRRTRPPHTRDSADTATPAPVPEPPPAIIPQLEQILTAEQRQAYNEEIDRNIAIAQRTVEALQGRRLSPEQTAYLTRVRAFIEQANQARATDLVRARNLSARASVLAEDLIKSVQ